MSPTELQKGGNTVIGAVGGDLQSVVIGLSWDSGALECDVCALVCGPERKVVSDDHFLFWSNVVTPDRSVFLRFQQYPPDTSLDRAQVMIALADLPDSADRIVISLSTIVEQANLGSVRGLRMRAFDPATGNELAVFVVDDSALTTEACLIVGEVYQHNGNWKIKAIAQGYQSGLAGLGTDFGVNIV